MSEKNHHTMVFIKKFLLVAILLMLTSCLKRQEIRPELPAKKPDVAQLVDPRLREIANRKTKNAILLLLPMSGHNAAIGNGILNACITASQESNNKNTDFFLIDVADNKLEKSQLHSRFKNKNLIAIVGPVFFNEAKRYGALFPNIPMFTFSNNLSANNNHVIACGLSPQDEIYEILSYMQKKQIDGLLAMIPSGNYGDEILSCLKKSMRHSGFDEEDCNIIRYDSISKEHATKCVGNSGKKAVFIVDPILNMDELDENIIVFTLSAPVFANKDIWNGSTFAFADNKKLSKFTKKYKFIFGRMPSILDIIGYDIMNVIYDRVSSGGKFNPFDETYSGCLGEFNIRKNKGLKRKLQLSTLHQ